MTPTDDTVPLYVITEMSRYDFCRDEHGGFWVRRCPGEGAGPLDAVPVRLTQLQGDGEFLPLLSIDPVVPGQGASLVLLQRGGPVVRTTTYVVDVLWRDGREERFEP